jgi:hypothetical protein
MRRFDRLLVGAVLLLVVVVAADALRGHAHRSAAPKPPPARAEAVAVGPVRREARSEMSDPFAGLPGCAGRTFRRGRAHARVRAYGLSAEGPVRCRGAG